MSSAEACLGAEQYCYLTTIGGQTGQLHEIKIWFAAAGNTSYLMNDGTRRSPGASGWVRNAQAQPTVRVRIRDKRFAGEARAVPFDSAEHERARNLLVAKYATTEDGLSRWRPTAFPVAISRHPAGAGGQRHRRAGLLHALVRAVPRRGTRRGRNTKSGRRARSSAGKPDATWRRGRDSNSRGGCPPTRFPVAQRVGHWCLLPYIADSQVARRGVDCSPQTTVVHAGWGMRWGRTGDETHTS